MGRVGKEGIVRGRNRWICGVAAVAVWTGAAARAADAPACPDGTERFAEYRLFFGRARDGAEIVSDEAWSRFLATEVTPRFPAGLTVHDGAGQWRNAAGRIERERSKLLVVIAPPGAAALRRTGEIAEAYKRSFGQESVLRAVSTVCASF